MFSQLYAIASRINSILLAVLFASMASNALSILLAIHLELQGEPATVIGWVMSGYAMGILLGSQFGYLVIDRAGHIRGFAVAGAIMIIAVSLHLLFSDVWLVFFLRLVVGAAMATLYLIMESWLNATSEYQSRATVYGMYQASFGIGLLVAPFLATFYQSSDIRAFAVVTLIFTISLLPLMLTKFPSPQLSSGQKNLPIIEMLRDTPSGAVMAVLAGLAYICLGTLLPLFALWLELSSGQMAIFLALATGSSIAFQIPVGRLADTYDERFILLGLSVVCLLSAVVSYVLSQMDVSWWIITIPIVFFGGSVSTIYPVCVKFIFNQMDADKALPAMSSLMIFFGVGLIFGPLIGSGVMQLLDPSGLFIFLAGLMAIALVFMIYRVRVSRFPDNDSENVPYVITVQMVRPVNANLDPRTDYLITRVSNSSIQALAQSIGITPRKTHTLIEQSLPFLEGYQPEEVLEALVMLKPRHAQRIIQTMLSVYPDNAVSFTHALGDLISLNKQAINTLVFEGLRFNQSVDVQNEIQHLFKNFQTGEQEPFIAESDVVTQ